jgi:alpha-ketoglutarate-dependent 2,4-dichlorophenoxyacetate dioxygenase
VVIWDNRCVLHRGRPWPHDQVRIMTRTTIANEAARNEWVL